MENGLLLNDDKIDTAGYRPPDFKGGNIGDRVMDQGVYFARAIHSYCSVYIDFHLRHHGTQAQVTNALAAFVTAKNHFDELNDGQHQGIYVTFVKAPGVTAKMTVLRSDQAEKQRPVEGDRQIS